MSLPSPPIRVMIVDDHPLAQSGLQAILSRFHDLQEVAEASNGADACTIYRRVRPDVVLMDLLMPEMDGVAATKALRELDSGARIVILSSAYDSGMIERAIQAGACGYMLKHATALEIAQAIRNAHAGRTAISPEVQDTLLQALQDKGSGSGELTDREREVLRLVAQGLSNQVIGDRLGVSRSTVKYYLANIFDKLQVKTRSAAIALAYERKLLVSEE